MGRQEERGKLKQLEGRGREIVGILTGNSEMELEVVSTHLAVLLPGSKCSSPSVFEGLD